MDKKKVFLLAFVALIPLFLILFSYKMVFIFAKYTPEQQKVIDFLEDKTELEINITKMEVSHLEDVKKVAKKIDYVFYSLLLICTLIFTYGFKDEEGTGRKLLFYGGIATFSLAGLLLIFILTNFDFLFNVFHRVFFPQGNWVFDVNSFLIQTFCIDFFISLVKKIVFLGLILASIFIGGGIYLKYVKKD